MRWSKERPSAPGWWWVRWVGNEPVECHGPQLVAVRIGPSSFTEPLAEWSYPGVQAAPDGTEPTFTCTEPGWFDCDDEDHICGGRKEWSRATPPDEPEVRT